VTFAFVVSTADLESVDTWRVALLVRPFNTQFLRDYAMLSGRMIMIVTIDVPVGARDDFDRVMQTSS